MSPIHIRVFPSADALADAAAELLIETALASIEREGTFTLGLSGGSTPRLLYQKLAGEALAARIPWAKVELFFGDERCVPPGHRDSNYHMVEETLLEALPIAESQVHHMRGEIDPEQAAREYDELLRKRFGEAGGLDLLLLGMGDDGHTASLFPGTEALKELQRLCVANSVPQLNTWRLTMTAPFLNRARVAAVLVAGPSKAQRLQEVLEGPRDPQRLPIQLIELEQGQMHWLIDAAAAGM